MRSAPAEEGAIEIAWQIRQRAEERSVTFRWRERGVTLENVARGKGFGSRAIEQALPRMLGGTARLSFHSDGAECMAEFPLPE